MLNTHSVEYIHSWLWFDQSGLSYVRIVWILECVCRMQMPFFILFDWNFIVRQCWSEQKKNERKFTFLAELDVLLLRRIGINHVNFNEIIATIAMVAIVVDVCSTQYELNGLK